MYCTYPVAVVDIRPNLVLLVPARRVLGFHLAVGGHKPVARADAFAVAVVHVVFQGADVGELV